MSSPKRGKKRSKSTALAGVTWSGSSCRPCRSVILGKEKKNGPPLIVSECGGFQIEPLLKLLADRLHSALARGTAQRPTALGHVTAAQPIRARLGLKAWLGFFNYYFFFFFLLALLIRTGSEAHRGRPKKHPRQMTHAVASNVTRLSACAGPSMDASDDKDRTFKNFHSWS